MRKISTNNYQGVLIFRLKCMRKQFIFILEWYFKENILFQFLYPQYMNVKLANKCAQINERKFHLILKINDIFN